ncbi:MAG: hypothetical protein HY265_05375 [Deltaproteobacteria bacterium]|nr:hypothetical protein [Deltaproteobacteria bacterium]
MIKRLADYLGNPENAGKLKKILYMALAVIVVADILVPREHAVFFWDSIPAWSAVFGIVSIVLIVAVAKILGFALRKNEDYYD